MIGTLAAVASESDFGGYLWILAILSGFCVLVSDLENLRARSDSYGEANVSGGLPS